jgi:hypothetical protein
MGVLALVIRGLDPDGEEFGAQIPLVYGVEVQIATPQGLSEVEVLIDKALRGVGVAVNDEGGLMNPCGALRFGFHLG